MKPIIAAVNGFAIGGGFELALACDIRIASEKAKFGVFEVRQGLHQGDGGIVRLVAVAGIGTALDLTLTGREVSAEEAYRLGLVSKVVPHEDLLPTAESWARMLLANGQQAIRSAKETILEVIGRPLDDALRLETVNGYSSVGDFREVAERLQKFFGKNTHGGAGMRDFPVTPRRRVPVALRPHGPHERHVVRRKVRRGDVAVLRDVRADAVLPAGTGSRHGGRPAEHHL